MLIGAFHEYEKATGDSVLWLLMLYAILVLLCLPDLKRKYEKHSGQKAGYKANNVE